MARTSGSNEAMYSSTEPGLPFEGAMSGIASTQSNVPVQRRRADLRALALYPSPVRCNWLLGAPRFMKGRTVIFKSLLGGRRESAALPR